MAKTLSQIDLQVKISHDRHLHFGKNIHVMNYLLRAVPVPAPSSRRPPNMSGNMADDSLRGPVAARANKTVPRQAIIVVKMAETVR